MSENIKKGKIMLNEPTMTKLYGMKLNGMAEAYEEQRNSSTITELSFEERFGILHFRSPDGMIHLDRLLSDD